MRLAAKPDALLKPECPAKANARHVKRLTASSGLLLKRIKLINLLLFLVQKKFILSISSIKFKA